MSGQDVLLFIDNIFRFVQAGSEVSALLGRMPSRRRLPADARHRDGRAAGAHHLDQARLDHLGAGHLRAGRRPHRPGAGDDLRPPRRHHRALARRSSRWASIPAVDPLDSTSRILDPRRRRRRALRRRPRRAGDPAALQGPAGHHRHPRHGRAVRRGQARRAARAARSSASSRSRSSWPRQFTGIAGQVRAARRTRCAASRRSSTASTTTCPSRPSTWSAASKKPSSRREELARPRSGRAERRRRGPSNAALHVEVVTPDGDVLQRRRGDGRAARRGRASSASCRATSRW